MYNNTYDPRRNKCIKSVFGCIDGTYVRIVAPRKDVQHLYLNRKGYHSLNVMIMCDYKMNVRYVDARHHGTNHDSLIFNLSDLNIHLQTNFQQNTWTLGDTGYPLYSYLMTSFRMTDAGSPQARYNTVHAKARNIVDRSIGVLKSRFRCLLSARGLHYLAEKSTEIVNVSCALHNISLRFQGEISEPEIITENEDATVKSSNTNMEDSEVGISIRNNIMQSF